RRCGTKRGCSTTACYAERRRRRFMKAGELKGKAVVSMADGVQVGRVEDILFDTPALRVAALVLTTTGGRSILPFAAVRSLGTRSPWRARRPRSRRSAR